MDESMVDSVFDDGANTSDAFSPQPKPAKVKAAAKKASSTTTTSKTKPAPKKPVSTTAKPKATKVAPKKRAKPESDVENSDVDLNSSVHDDSLLSNTPPSAKRQKKAPVLKKTPGEPLAEISNESFEMDGVTVDSPKPKKKAGGSGETYQKLTQLEHILKRPDTYIGSVEQTQQRMWVFNSETSAMESREVNFVPGLYKIFDEILVNAADNKVRDKNMDEIRVVVDREKGFISVRNNGRGIPIEIHATEKIYVPELIFGHLLTSSNYDDDQDKITGGRNGYGAKLCNVYSTSFTLETVDSKSKQKYTQTWTNNMSNMGTAKIVPAKTEDYTQVTFYPDFAKFGMKEMDADFEALVKRRVYDMAGTCKGVKVYLNGDRLKVRNFKQYMEMYTKAIKAENEFKELDEVQVQPTDMNVIITDTPHERWEIGFAVSDGSFQQVSFVNSIATTSGGTHVNYIADQIVNKLIEVVKKKNKGGVALKAGQIRNHIFLFVNCHITNPAFTSQTKEQLTTKASQFGSKCSVSEKFLKDIAKTEAVNNIILFANKKADQILKKSDGSKRQRMNNSKLTDANKAGTKDGHRCTLILTEGDSAALLALAGRAVVDPDLIGVFPLRGKMLNVRDASIDQISKNAEIQNIKQFMGLQHKRVYEDTKSLRYGHLMIMTDQDHDGSHIKGLLINFLECQFPSLLKIPSFLQEFITPIVKVWKGDPKHPKKLQSFFTMPEYEAWKQIAGNERGWDHKYYKGLGTSEAADAQIYFSDPDQHLKVFHTMQPHEPGLIDLAFSKKKADARKEWLRQFVPGTYLDMNATKEITYDDFINKELVLFSMADNMRSIPSVVDGLKPGQRKVLYTCFRRNLKKDVKVVELAGSVSGLTAYAYGETSLQQTIVGLAQNFVGSNNINCLEPSGNFGSRLQGGSDAASARYIYTRLSPFARRLFHASDEPLLSYNTDDGKTIEPEMYCPILPMILVNGSDGIGTGWSSSIPNYHPEEIVENLKRRMNGTCKEDMLPMKPWFRGWSGETEDIGGDRFKFAGKAQQTGDNEIEITELPVRMWTQDFKDKLEEIIKAEKFPSFIKDYTEYNTPTKVHFILKMEDKYMKISIEKGLEEMFKLSKTMATTNLVAFDGQGRINKYATVLDIMEEFYHIRLSFYQKRKEYLLNEMQQDLDKMSNQARFIKMIVDGKLVVSRKKKAALVAELRKLDFKPIPKIADARKVGEFEPVVDDNVDAEEANEDESIGAHDYDYLLGMAIWSLTQERIDKLMKQIGDKEGEIDKLITTSPKELWNGDLDGFLEEWKYQLEDEAKRAKRIAGLGRRASTKLRIGAKGGKKRKAGDDGDEADSDFVTAKPSKKVSTSMKAGASSKPAPKKTNALSSWLETSTASSTTAAPLLNSIEQKPVAKPPAEDRGLLVDGTADVKLEDSAATITIPALASKQAAKSIKKTIHSDDSDEDVFAEIAKEASTSTKPTAKPTAASRTSRVVAKKPIKYTLSSDSSDGEDLLGEVSNMVKGMPSASGAEEKPLFASATTGAASASRPSSSHSFSAGISKSRRSAIPLSDVEDETDYKSLVPKDSPVKLAARNGRDMPGSSDGEEDDSFGIGAAGRAKIATTTGKLKVAAPKGKVVKAAAKEGEKEKKPSVAAKASAAKQAKGALAAAKKGTASTSAVVSRKAAPKKKNVVDSEDDDGDEGEAVDALANEILGDDGEDAVQNDEEDETEVPVQKPTGRAPRRTAAVKAKSKYILAADSDDDEEEGEESEVDFDDDSE